MTKPMEQDSISVTVLHGLDQIAEADWDACACPETAEGGAPFSPYCVARHCWPQRHNVLVRQRRNTRCCRVVPQCMHMSMVCLLL